ncbi:MAG: hypothetical protein NTU54_05500 [Candidatus Omnitrophica bacterium]|nr:hypothetical protein [Candidatus Omnitrophota bacterium]
MKNGKLLIKSIIFGVTVFIVTQFFLFWYKPLLAFVTKENLGEPVKILLYNLLRTLHGISYPFSKALFIFLKDRSLLSILFIKSFDLMFWVCLFVTLLYPTPKKRLVGVTIYGIFIISVSLTFLYSGIGNFFDSSLLKPHLRLWGISYIILSLLSLISAVTLLLLKTQGRILTICASVILLLYYGYWLFNYHAMLLKHSDYF